MPLLHFLIPFGLLVLLTVVFRRPLWLAAAISYCASLLLFVLMGQAGSGLMNGLAMGVFVAFEISLVLTGAIFFLNFLKENQVIDRINEGLKSISSNKILQVFLLCWLFGSFIEGSAGFGTPALIIAPLLAALGFPVLLAVALPLLADTTAVAFGAVGTPIKIGFAGLQVAGVTTTTALLNVCTGFVVPLLLLWATIKNYPDLEVKNPRKYIPFAVWVGFAFTLPSWAISFLGPEFPSLLGGLAGLFIVILSIRKRFLLSTTEMDQQEQTTGIRSFLLAFVPYIGLSLLLIAGRLLLHTNYINIQIWEGLSRRFNLFQPGMAFFTMPFLLLLLLPKNYRWNSLMPSIKSALNSVPKPAIAILFIAAIAQNLVLSGQSFLSPVLPGLPNWLAVFLVPFFGALGSFAAGSATVSNLLFGQEIFSVASSMQISTDLMLSLQLLGGSIGNAVALQNIAVVQAAIHCHGQEKPLLKMLFLPVIIYLIIVGLTGVLFL